MLTFRIRLAGVVAEMTVNFEDTRHFCRHYLTKDQPDFSFTVTMDEIHAEQESFHRTFPENPYFTENVAENQIAFRKTMQQMPHHHVLLFHGVTLEMDGRAYLFTAPSGTGKTTHAGFWLQKFGDRARIINGDKPLLLPVEGGILACGSPWQGSENYGCNCSVPLRAICALERGEVNEIRPVTIVELLPTLLQQAYYPPNREGKLLTLPMIEALKEIGLYRMRCNLDPEAAVVAYEAMK